MPSSLAAALAASKKTADKEATSKPKDPPVKPCAPSSSTSYYDKQAGHTNNPARKHNSNHLNSEIPSSKHAEEGKQQTPKSRNRKDVNKAHHPSNHTRARHGNNHAVAVDEIVFLCDIPSDDDDNEESLEDSRLELDALVIDDRNTSGKGRGRGGRMHDSARNYSNDNGGRVLNVNASRRLIGHALGTRLGPASNSGKYDAQNGRDSVDEGSNNNRCPNNPGAMPTPWSTRAQEVRGKNPKNILDDSQSGNGRKNEGCNTTKNRIKGEFSQKIERDNNEAMSNNVSETSPMPKLESAVLKGRWADEDSSDDE